jgi:hypothetical protein
MSDEIHDHSRVDAFMAARRRAMVLHAVWRPMLAGAAGAALVIGCVWVTLPKISYREIEVPRVTMRDVPVPNIVPHDVQVDHVIPREVVIEIPKIVPADRPLTADEERFASKPEYQDAPYHGRIVASTGGGALSFADGKNFYPAHLDPVTSQPVFDPEHAFASEEFVGDLGLCRQDPSNHLWDCSALHDGRDTPIGYKPGRPT